MTHLHYDHLMGLLHFSSFPTGARLRFFSCFDNWFGQDSLRRFLSPPYWPYTPDFGDLCSLSPPASITLEHGITADFRRSIHPDGCMLVSLRFQGKRVCFAWDYEHGSISLDDWARGCDLLLYDGTYTPEEYGQHRGWGHSTWQEGCRLAARIGVARLLISHHSPDADDGVLRRAEQEAKSVFPHAHFARECEVISL